jgi:DNA replication protein DnaC
MADGMLSDNIFPPVWFTSWLDLEQRLRIAMVTQSADEVLQAIEDNVACLVLDDVDVGAPSPWRESVLYRLFERPNRNRRIIVTMNRSPADAPGAVTERCASRLIDPGLFLSLHVTRA